MTFNLPQHLTHTYHAVLPLTRVQEGRETTPRAPLGVEDLRFIVLLSRKVEQRRVIEEHNPLYRSRSLPVYTFLGVED